MNGDRRPATWLPPGEWRVGTSSPANVWIDNVAEGPRGVQVGRMDSPALAAYVCAAVNERNHAIGQVKQAYRMADRNASELADRPTREAYTAAVRAIEKHRDRADQLRAALEHIAGAAGEHPDCACEFPEFADAAAHAALKADDAAREAKP